jgi:hypothetical protein
MEVHVDGQEVLGSTHLLYKFFLNWWSNGINCI